MADSIETSHNNANYSLWLKQLADSRVQVIARARDGVIGAEELQNLVTKEIELTLALQEKETSIADVLETLSVEPVTRYTAASRRFAHQVRLLSEQAQAEPFLVASMVQDVLEAEERALDSAREVVLL